MENKVDIYILDFLENYKYLDYFTKILSEEEKIRSNRFYFEIDQKNFTISRGILKLLLSKYLNKLPKEIFFESNNYGKPFIKNSNIKFNISHTKEILALAFSFDTELGIDVEKIREIKLYQDIVKRFFSENEIKEFFSLPENEYQNTFFTIWTRKEAFIKAIGMGLSAKLDSFDVSILETETEIKRVSVTNYKKENWKLFNIPVISTHKASLVTENKSLDLKFYDDKDITFLLS